MVGSNRFLCPVERFESVQFFPLEQNKWSIEQCTQRQHQWVEYVASVPVVEYIAPRTSSVRIACTNGGVS